MSSEDFYFKLWWPFGWVAQNRLGKFGRKPDMGNWQDKGYSVLEHAALRATNDM